jgi:hypothetical protein
MSVERLVAVEEPNPAMGEEPIKHITAATRRPFTRNLPEIAKVRDLFSKRERAVRDILFDPCELLSSSSNVCFARSDRPHHLSLILCP